MIDLNHLSDISRTIRGLSIDAINTANSGHPGLPLGCADIMAVLYGYHLKHNPKEPLWENRDRFILSAGHGSILLYALLHITGYALSLEDLKNFRKPNAITAGHPEYEPDKGIETTTGPLGQGIGHAVGMALSLKMKAARFNTPFQTLIDATVYCLAGDGCLMEGISAEASSLAGHLNCDNLIVIYDSNDICLDGPTSECFTEDVEKRYIAYGWTVLTMDGHDFEDIDKTLTQAKQTSTPTLIIAKTSIGFGSPNRINSSEAHGKPLGIEEGNATKEALGVPIDPLFYVPESVLSFFKTAQIKQHTAYSQWLSLFKEWHCNEPALASLYATHKQRTLPLDVINAILAAPLSSNLASRASSQELIQVIATSLPYIIGGSADLSCSDSTYIKASATMTSSNYTARNIKYGVREFAMSTIAAGLSLSGFFKPFIGTFLTFSDYMKNGIRLTALMNTPVIYQFTHDSIFLGEDGPTHQPVEQLASLRSIPNLSVIRPADKNEVKGAWIEALKAPCPTALILSRQSLPDLPHSAAESVAKGAYIIHQTSPGSDTSNVTILATGSEVNLAIHTATVLEKNNITCTVVSFPSWDLFDKQDQDYKDHILPENTHYVVMEAQSSFGWHKYTGKYPTCITVESFGLSGSAKDITPHFGFDNQTILDRIQTDYKQSQLTK